MQLSLKEKVVLFNSYENGDKFIARDSFGAVCIYWNKPKKGRTDWINRGFGHYEYITNDTFFQLVKWENEEPYEIEGLLEEVEYMEQFIIKLKNILVKSGLKTEKELENLSDIDIQKLIIDNFIQLKTSKLFISQEEYIYILKDQFEIIKKYNLEEVN